MFDGNWFSCLIGDVFEELLAMDNAGCTMDNGQRVIKLSHS